jgi:hypothetical protein
MDSEGNRSSVIGSGVHGLCRAFIGEFSTLVMNDLWREPIIVCNVTYYIPFMEFSVVHDW